MIAGSLQDKVQCNACHNYADVDDSACPHCNALLPKGVAEMAVRARNVPTERAQERAAYNRYKQEATYVPRWMRRVVLAFNYAYQERGVHRLVQWGGGALGFFFAFGLSQPLISQIPLPGSAGWTPHRLLPLQCLAGLIAFAITSRFIFAVFHNIVANMVQVFGDEQDAMILQGETEEKVRRSRQSR